MRCAGTECRLATQLGSAQQGTDSNVSHRASTSPRRAEASAAPAERRAGIEQERGAASGPHLLRCRSIGVLSLRRRAAEKHDHECNDEQQKCCRGTE
jgi:hypothetical protein